MKKIAFIITIIIFISDLGILILWKASGYYYGISPVYKYIVSKPLPFDIEPRYWSGFGIPIGMNEFDFDNYISDGNSQYQLMVSEFYENEPDSYKKLNDYWSKRDKILAYGYNDSVLIFNTIDSCDIIKYYECKSIDTFMSSNGKKLYYRVTDKTVSKEYFNAKKKEIKNWVELYSKTADSINSEVFVIIYNLLLIFLLLIILVFIFKHG